VHPTPTELVARQHLTMSLVSDQLANGRKLRVLAIFDEHYRRYVALEVRLYYYEI
jgi:hypothetical protein